MSAPRIIGIFLALLGAASSIFPSWFGPLTEWPQPPADAYEAIERRVRGGMLLGVGWALLAIPALRPWSISIASAFFYLMAGALAARVLGIALEGAVPKQWLLVGVEAAMMAAAASWIWWRSALP